MVLEKLASAIQADVLAGLSGMRNNISMDMEQLIDDIIDERVKLLEEYKLQGLKPEGLETTINCIDIDCKDFEKCSCYMGTPTAHFEIPQYISLSYIGSIDKFNPFTIYETDYWLKLNTYRKRKNSKPYVFIDGTPNSNGMIDVFIFNAPLLKNISVKGIFKDLRQLEKYKCCNDISDEVITPLNSKLKDIVTKKKLMYYRQYIKAPISNTQINE